MLLILLAGSRADGEAHACNINDDGDSGYDRLARRFYVLVLLLIMLVGTHANNESHTRNMDDDAMVIID